MESIRLLKEQVTFLESIIRANKLHEDFCPAHFVPTGGLGDTFASLGRSECNCWLAPDLVKIVSEDETTRTIEAIGLYDLPSQTVLPHNVFDNRRDARLHVLAQYPNMSPDPTAENYWMKIYFPALVTVQLTKTNPESANDPSNH